MGTKKTRPNRTTPFGHRWSELCGRCKFVLWIKMDYVSALSKDFYVLSPFSESFIDRVSLKDNTMYHTMTQLLASWIRFVCTQKEYKT